MADNEITIVVKAKSNTAEGLTTAKAEARAAGDEVARTLAAAGEKAGDGFKRGVDGKLRDSRGRFVKEGAQAGEEFVKGIGDKLGGKDGKSWFGRIFESLADQAQNAADSAGKALAGIFPALAGLVESTVATGGLNLLILALLGLVAAAAAAAAGLIVLAPAVYLVAGSFGAAMTAGVGLASVVGSLVLGLGGLGDAWTAAGQKSSGGGRSAADAAWQVKQATLSLADAQREAKDAQAALTQARMDEQERLEDLSRSLAGARLDEEGAVLAVSRAEQRLRDARRSGNPLDYREAELGLRQAKQSLLEVQDRVGDLAQEQADANRKGIEGSDRVQAALRRQQQAQRAIEAATHALTQAQQGGAGGVDKYAQAMAALSPKAQDLIKKLVELKPRFDDLKKSVQDRLLDGLDRSIERLVNRSFPSLKQILGSTATAINGIFKGGMDALGDPEFLANIKVATGAFDKTLDRIGSVTVPKLLGAIGRLARASVPFWDELSDMALGWIEKFSDKIEKADKDKKLDKFFKEAAENLHKLREIGGTTIGILGSIVKILFPGSKRESKGFLDDVLANLQDVKAWLDDPDNKQKIQGWISDIQDFGDNLGETTGKISDIVDRVDGWTSKISGFIGKLKSWSKTADDVAGAPWRWIKEGFKTAMNWVIDKWNSLVFGMPSVHMFGKEIGGGSVGTTHVDRFDHGGIAGGLVSVAERSRELISMPGGGQLLALPQGSMVHASGQTEAMLGGRGGSTAIALSFEGGAGNSLEALLIQILRRYIRINGGKGTDSVQRALGWST
jgi:hypothetical protein